MASGGQGVSDEWIMAGHWIRTPPGTPPKGGDSCTWARVFVLVSVVPQEGVEPPTKRLEVTRPVVYDG